MRRVTVIVSRMKPITMPVLTCERCHHEWIPKRPQYPKRCAKCGSPYWETERKTPRATS